MKQTNTDFCLIVSQHCYVFGDREARSHTSYTPSHVHDCLFQCLWVEMRSNKVPLNIPS